MTTVLRWLYKPIRDVILSAVTGWLGIVFIMCGLLVVYVEDFKVGFTVCVGGFIMAVPYLTANLSLDKIRTKNEAARFEKIVASLKANEEFTSALIHIELELTSSNAGSVTTHTREVTKTDQELSDHEPTIASESNAIIKDVLQTIFVVVACLVLIAVLFMVMVLAIQFSSIIFGIGA